MATPDLTPEALSRVEQRLARERKNEPEISASLQEISQQISARLVGLEHRFKNRKRIDEKIEALLLGQIGSAPIEELLPHDSLRYTFIPEGDYLEGIKGIHDSLVARGFEQVRFKNYWVSETGDTSGYNGINTNYRSPSGIIFEIQFHSEDSFRAAQETHGDYEKMRILNETDTLKTELLRRSAERFARMPRERGVDACAAANPALTVYQKIKLDAVRIVAKHSNDPNTRTSFARRGPEQRDSSREDKGLHGPSR